MILAKAQTRLKSLSGLFRVVASKKLGEAFLQNNFAISVTLQEIQGEKTFAGKIRV